MSIVCSNCAAGLPSAVKVVQLSSQVMHSVVPSVSIGSARMVNVFKLQFGGDKYEVVQATP